MNDIDILRLLLDGHRRVCIAGGGIREGRTDFLVTVSRSRGSYTQLASACRPTLNDALRAVAAKLNYELKEVQP